MTFIGAYNLSSARPMLILILCGQIIARNSRIQYRNSIESCSAAEQTIREPEPRLQKESLRLEKKKRQPE